MDILGAIQENFIVCLECKNKFRHITNTHLMRKHRMSTKEYKKKHGYNEHTFLACKSFRKEKVKMGKELVKRGILKPQSIAGRPKPKGFTRRQEAILKYKRASRETAIVREQLYRNTKHPNEKECCVARLKELRQAGWSWRKLSQEFNLSPATLARKLGHQFPSDKK